MARFVFAFNNRYGFYHGSCVNLEEVSFRWFFDPCIVLFHPEHEMHYLWYFIVSCVDYVYYVAAQDAVKVIRLDGVFSATFNPFPKRT